MKIAEGGQVGSWVKLGYALCLVSSDEELSKAVTNEEFESSIFLKFPLYVEKE